jgi:hypothetical protein
LPSLKKLALKESEEFAIVLDKETTSNNPYYQLLETDSMTLLTFFNPLNHQLYFYDLDRGLFKQAIRFEKNGPNGVGERVTSYNIVNRDSIILHSYNRRKLLYANWKGQLMGDLTLFNDQLEIAPQTYMGAGPTRMDDWFYFYSGNSCMKREEFQPASIVRFTIDGKVAEEVMDFPDSYLVPDKGYWPRKLCNVFSTYNPGNQTVIYSYPLHSKVISVSSSGTIQEYEMSLPDFIEQESLSPSEYPGDPFAEFKAFLRYSRFANVYYDPYRNVYLRSFYRATSPGLLEQNKLISEKLMVVANDKFEILGELDFKGTENILFGKKGLYQVLYDTKSEDTLRIKRYEYAFLAAKGHPVFNVFSPVLSVRISGIQRNSK